MSKKEIKSVNYGLEKIFEGAQDFLPLMGTDYVEFYVGNAKQAAHFYKTAFGFQSYAYRGLETGSKDTVSYVLKQDKIRLVLTTPLNSKSPINNHIVKHGDGVKVVVFGAKTEACADPTILQHEKQSMKVFARTFKNVDFSSKNSIFTALASRHPFYNGKIYPKISS